MRIGERIGCIIAAICSMTLMVSGCSSINTYFNKEMPEPVNVALVIGNHSNAPAPDLRLAEKYIKEAIKTYGFVTVIGVDGKPFQQGYGEILPPQKKLSDSKRKELEEKQMENILAMAETVKAKTPEVDTLGAIELGARALRARDNGQSKMIIFQSGISTTGLLDYTQTLLEALDPEEIVASLEEELALPDLHEIQITWIGLGDTEEPQKPLSSKNRVNLKCVWEKILTEAGADIIFSEEIPDANDPRRNLPEVSTVEVLEPGSIIQENGYDPDQTLVFDSETLNFKPGSPELLRSRERAEEILAPIGEYLASNPEEKILLCGTTASAGTQEELVVLSNSRCSTVKKLLLNLGASEDQIKTIGLGFKNHPFYIKDTNPDGSLNEEQARKNRAVIILPGDSDLAEQILGKK